MKTLKQTDLYDMQVLQHNIARLITAFSEMRWTNVKAISQA